jgi:hypothetical protein
MKIRIKNRWFNKPKILKTPEERQMGYQYLDEEDIDESNNCLFFVFDKEEPNRKFHMRNCDSFDIQLYALNKKRKLVQAFPMARSSDDVYEIQEPCMYIVEVPLFFLSSDEQEEDLT